MVDPWWIQHRIHAAGCVGALTIRVPMCAQCATQPVPSRARSRARISTLNGHTHWQGVTGEAVNPEYLDRRFDSYEDEFLHQKPQQISSTFT